MATKILGGLGYFQHSTNPPDPAAWVDAAGMFANRSQYPDLAALVGLLNADYYSLQGTMPSSCSSLAAGGGVFTAIPTAATQNTLTSSNGLKWVTNSAVLPASATWQNLTFGAGVFVAFKNSATVDYATSTDGVTWTPRVLPIAVLVKRCVFDGTRFLIVEDGKTAAYTSTDGVNWNSITITTGSATGVYSWVLAIPGSNGFVLYHTGTNLLSYSATGASWTATSIVNTTFGSGAASDTTIVLTAGETIYVSADHGVTWSYVPKPFAGSNNMLIYFNGAFLLGTSSNTYASTDGLHWYQRKPLPATPLNFYPAHTTSNIVILAPSNTSVLNVFPPISATQFWVPQALPASPITGQRNMFRAKL